MDRRLIWAIKSGEITPTRKRLEELCDREDLFDESKLDTKAYNYKRTVESFDKAAQMGYSVVTFIDKEYPQKLRNITMPPPVLYVRGNVAILNDVVYAGIVGSRKSDMYGLQMANSIAREIGQTGAGIISGGAEGVDAAAHEGALRVKAPTIAVLGNGIDIDYPAVNKELFKRIEENGGAIISEFVAGTIPDRNNFPRRNRIIAAMSTALVVARAAKRSGALITANQAVGMNKTVFAVPGNIDNGLSVGTNELIRDGALVLVSPMDVIDELIAKEPDFFVREKEPAAAVRDMRVNRSEANARKKAMPSLSEYENEIINIIKSGADTNALIEEKISFEASRLTALLGMLEIKGIIKKKADKRYRIIGGES